MLQNLINQQRGGFHYPNVEIFKADNREIIRKHYLKQGCSRSVSKRAASCRRNSTNKTKDNRLYFDLAEEKHINRLQASEPFLSSSLQKKIIG